MHRMVLFFLIDMIKIFENKQTGPTENDNKSSHSIKNLHCILEVTKIFQANAMHVYVYAFFPWRRTCLKFWGGKHEATKTSCYSEIIKSLHRNSNDCSKVNPGKYYLKNYFGLQDLRGGLIYDQVKLVQFWMKYVLKTYRKAHIYYEKNEREQLAFWQINFSTVSLLTLSNLRINVRRVQEWKNVVVNKARMHKCILVWYPCSPVDIWSCLGRPSAYLIQSLR